MHRTAADHNLVRADSEEVVNRYGVTVLDRSVEDLELRTETETFSAVRLDVGSGSIAVHGLDAGDESFAVGELAVPNFAGEVFGQLSGFPGLSILPPVEMPRSFFRGDD